MTPLGRDCNYSYPNIKLPQNSETCDNNKQQQQKYRLSIDYEQGISSYIITSIRIIYTGT